MKDEYYDTIHQGGSGKDFESEYSDILHDESFGNEDSKIGPTLALKGMREKEKKTRCQDTHFETIHDKSNCNESFWHRRPRKWIDSYPEGKHDQKRRVTMLVSIGNMTLLYDLKHDSRS